MMYKECANCGCVSDDGATIERNVNGTKRTIHLCPSCCDISEKDKTKLLEKFAEFDFKEFYKENGLIMVKLIDVNINTDEDMYYRQQEQIVDFATENRLYKFVYQEGTHTEHFYADDIEKVITYIVEHFGNGQLDRESVKSEISTYKPVPTIAEILSLTGISMAEFSRMFHIPYRTVQDWKSGKRKASIWAVLLLIQSLKRDYNRTEIDDIDKYYNCD